MGKEPCLPSSYPEVTEHAWQGQLAPNYICPDQSADEMETAGSNMYAFQDECTS